MSVQVADLVAQLRADISKFEAGLKQAEQAMGQTGEKIGQKADEVGRGFTGLSKAIKGNEEALQSLGSRVALFGAAATAAVALAIKGFTDFEASIARAVGAAGGGMDDMRLFSSTAKQMGDELSRAGVSAAQAGDALFFIASAGFKGQQAIDALRPSLELAAATQTDLSSITSTVISVLNQFGLTTEETARVTNVFAAVNQASLATMEKLSDAFRDAGPAAAAMGKRIEETAAALAVFFNAGLDASTAGTSFRNIMLNLLDVTPKAKQALAQFGLTAEDLNPQLHSLADIIDLLNKKQVDTATIAELVGKRAFAAFQALLKNGGDQLREMEKRLTDTNATLQQLQVQTDRSGATFQEFASQVGLLRIELGERFLGAIAPILGALTGMTRVARTMPEPFQELVAILGVGVAGTATVTGAGLLLVSQLPKLTAGFTLLKQALDAATASSTLLALSLKAIPLAVTIFVAFKVGEGLTELIDNLTGLSDKLSGAGKFDQANQILIEGLKALAKTAQEARVEVEKLQQVSDAVRSFFSDLRQMASASGSALVSEQLRASGKIVEAVQEETNQKMTLLTRATLQQIKELNQLQLTEEQMSQARLLIETNFQHERQRIIFAANEEIRKANQEFFDVALSAAKRLGGEFEALARKLEIERQIKAIRDEIAAINHVIAAGHPLADQLTKLIAALEQEIQNVGQAKPALDLSAELKRSTVAAQELRGVLGTPVAQLLRPLSEIFRGDKPSGGLIVMTAPLSEALRGVRSEVDALSGSFSGLGGAIGGATREAESLEGVLIGESVDEALRAVRAMAASTSQQMLLMVDAFVAAVHQGLDLDAVLASIEGNLSAFERIPGSRALAVLAELTRIATEEFAALDRQVRRTASTLSALGTGARPFGPSTVRSFQTEPGEARVVPGPIGAPMPAIVHGGERISSPEGVVGGVTIIVQGTTFLDSERRLEELAERIDRKIQSARRRGTV